MITEPKYDPLPDVAEFRETFGRFADVFEFIWERLGKQESEIMKYRIAGATFADIAMKYGVTPERIRQIEAKAKARLDASGEVIRWLGRKFVEVNERARMAHQEYVWNIAINSLRKLPTHRVGECQNKNCRVRAMDIEILQARARREGF